VNKLKSNIALKNKRVLFVASTNSDSFRIGTFIESQGSSLEQVGIQVSYFPVKGKGILGYLKAAYHLHKHIKGNNYDIVHAHYSLSGWVAVIAFTGKPTVLSLMGDDALGTYVGPGKIKLTSYFLPILTIAIQPFVAAIICKSVPIQRVVIRRRISYVIPNGVNLVSFKPSSSNLRKDFGLQMSKRYVLFLGDPLSSTKNFSLVREAYGKLDNPDIDLLAPFPVGYTEVSDYLNIADVLVLTSFMEGSPNVIKEAMACNCPIVATDVGDVKWVLGNTEGCFVASFEPEDVADKLKLALKFSEEKGRTRGRDRIIKIGLDSNSVARKIVEVYIRVLEK
jgi:glycosyltransferase involved in cell wall biosynthesis